MTPQEWGRFLSGELGVPVNVRSTRSRRAPLTLRRERILARPSLELRLHPFFEHAPEDVREAVVAWARSGRRARRACAQLTIWIEGEIDRLPPRPVDPASLSPRGRHHDLEPMLDDLLRTELSEELAGKPRPLATWGRVAPSRTRGSLRLGSFDTERGLARIHPALDQPGVPGWFVRYVLFHELLHCVFPPHRDGQGRWIHHPPQLLARERAYPDHRRALEWEARRMGDLVRSARTQRPLREEKPRKPRRGGRTIQRLLGFG